MKSRATWFFLLATAATLLTASATAVNAQGMVSAPSELGEIGDLEGLASSTPQQVSTIQRLLRRLGYLADANMTRKFDEETAKALAAHFKAVNTSPSGMTNDGVIRSLFTAAWTKEGWASGSVDGQDLVADKAEVRSAQESLAKLGYAPGPVDGVFGPATFSAIEVFQEDNDMNITGLLTRNTYQNILLAVKFADKQPESVVRVLNWPDYISLDTLQQFEDETNIRIVHEVFRSTAETKELLQQGSDRYDLMIQAGAQMRQVLEAKDSVEQLDHAKLSNARHLDPAALKFTDVLDPGNKHSVPYMWGTVGLAINKEKVRALRPDAPLDSLALILDPALAADLSRCGIAIVDEPNDTIPAFAAYRGSDMQNIGITDLEVVDGALEKVAPYVKVVAAENFIDNVANGKYCVAWGYSGDIFLARDTAKENGTGAITYAVPKEGSQLWFDLLVIPSKSKNKEGAYQLINHMMKPEVAAANTNFLQYANPILASAEFIDPKLLKDPGLYPPKGVLKRLVVAPPLAVDVEAELVRIWSKLPKE